MTRLTALMVAFLAMQPPHARAGDVTAPWQKHVIFSGEHTNTAVAADFNGDGQVDVISNSGGKTRLFVAPDWRVVIIDENPEHQCIHSEVLDVDRDGDPDWIGARYDPGLTIWLENPGGDLSHPWTARVVDDQVHGIHGLLVADVDADGHPDLIANGAQPKGDFPESLAWYHTPAEPRTANRWPRFIAARGDAPGLTHYLGCGDINGDGRPDLMTAAKGGPMAPEGTGDWFAWWEAPQDATQSGWTKHFVARGEPGATNILPADVNGDGTTDLVCSRGHGFGLIWYEGPNWKPHAMDDSLEGPHCLTVADLDGDGDLDAATCAKDSQRTAWFQNDGHGGFTMHVVGDTQAAYDIRSADLDSDGDLDLLVAGQTSQNVVWYENPLK
ncbi:MAG: VCBS repeat-containing protein [Planctomycetaceae bacterium]|nr:VCBS repeat-containing protein [Planctomycetaceae bacterium]